MGWGNFKLNPNLPITFQLPSPLSPQCHPLFPSFTQSPNSHNFKLSFPCMVGKYHSISSSFDTIYQNRLKNLINVLEVLDLISRHTWKKIPQSGRLLKSCFIFSKHVELFENLFTSSNLLFFSSLCWWLIVLSSSSFTND